MNKTFLIIFVTSGQETKITEFVVKISSFWTKYYFLNNMFIFFARSEDVNDDADFLRIGPFAVASFLGSFFRA